MNKSTSESRLLYSVYFIYFFCGMAMCFEGAFMPEFKEHFQLSYQQQMYIMFAKNIPFILFSILIGLFSKKIGFKNCLAIALFLFAAGTALLIPGLHYGNYMLVLTAFFIIGTGFNFELVAGNPLLSWLGDPATSSSRLNLGNALGAIAQIISPLIIVILIPSTVVTVSGKITYINGLFIAISVILIVTGIITLFLKEVKTDHAQPGSEGSSDQIRSSPIRINRKLLSGFVAIFVALGAESGIFGLYRNYVESPDTSNLTSHKSYIWYTTYFAMFAAGRLIGALVQKKIRPASTLVFCVITAIILLFIMMTATGIVSVLSVTLLGMFISIFFPTLYAISIEGLGKNTAFASGFLTMGFLGAAILPVVQGKIADWLGLKYSFILSILSYLYVLYFALRENKKGNLIKA
jgi:FHS family L-fucose permease-like MFS transporter